MRNQLANQAVRFWEEPITYIQVIQTPVSDSIYMQESTVEIKMKGAVHPQESTSRDAGVNGEILYDTLLHVRQRYLSDFEVSPDDRIRIENKHYTIVNKREQGGLTILNLKEVSL